MQHLLCRTHSLIWCHSTDESDQNRPHHETVIDKNPGVPCHLFCQYCIISHRSIHRRLFAAFFAYHGSSPVIDLYPVSYNTLENSDRKFHYPKIHKITFVSILLNTLYCNFNNCNNWFPQQSICSMKTTTECLHQVYFHMYLAQLEINIGNVSGMPWACNDMENAIYWQCAISVFFLSYQCAPGA